MIRPRTPVADLEAYHHYLQGRYFRFTKLDLRAARASYEKAIARDPSYALAHLGLAEVFAVWSAYGFAPPAEALDRATRELALAREGLGDTANGMAIEGWLAWLHAWDTDAAVRALGRAIEMDPGSVTARAWHCCLLATRRDSEALDRELEVLDMLDSVSPYGLAMAAASWLLHGRIDEALAQSQRALMIEPGSLLAHWVCGLSAGAAGQWEVAVGTLVRGVELSSRGPFYLGFLAWAQAAAGRKQEARATLRELEDRAAREYIAPVFLAWGLAELGEMEGPARG